MGSNLGESKKRKRITYSNLQFSITPIMCDFINRAHGTKISKTELEMIVLQYIKKETSKKRHHNNGKRCVDIFCYYYLYGSTSNVT